LVICYFHPFFNCYYSRRYPKYSSYFELHVRWLRLLTPVTYQSKLPGIRALAAFLQLELFRVFTFSGANRLCLLEHNDA